MFSLIIDAVLVLIILFCAVISAKRGFVRTLVELVGGVIVIYAVLSFSVPVSEFIYEKTVEPSIVKSIEKGIKDGTESVTDKVWGALPHLVTDNAGMLGISKDKLENNISDKTDSGKIALSASKVVAKPVIVKIFSMLISFVGITVLLFVIRKLAILLNAAFKISFLGKINRFLGFLLGMGKGTVISVVFCIAVMFILSLNKKGFWFFTYENIEKTRLFSMLYGILPFKF